MIAPLYLRAVGLAAPGLPGWSAGRAVLAGAQPWAEQEEAPYAPQLLPPNERRRAPPGVRQAFRAGEDARAGCTLDFSALAAVFASSDSDLTVMDRINTALAEPVRAVSPTDFHNSVHNAAGGYWSIATACRQPSTAVGGHDGSLAMGLLEAAALVHGDGYGVLLVAFDGLPPPLLRPVRPMACAGSIALVLHAEPAGAALARLDLSLTDAPETALEDPALERLRRGNPALRGLPLLRAVARGEAAQLVLPHAPGCNLAVAVEPVG
ncbi:MAG TPA: beta-ketoacyl synthase chain length factor [Nevskia sp.]|nr:beta-ketoacyl synthase chain length factor [Nevskia sp.]